MRQVLLFGFVMAVSAPLVCAAGIELPAPVRPIYAPPVVVMPVAPVLSPQTLTPAPTFTAAPTLTPTPTFVPAPAFAVGAPPQACERPSAGECAAEAGTCIAKKWMSRDHGYSQVPVFFVENDASGVPHVVRLTSDEANDDDNAEAAECGGDLSSCLARPCRN